MQVGGGSWEEVCYCCGFAMNATSPDNVEDFFDLTDEEKAEIKQKLENVDLSWMDKNIGYDTENGLVFLLGPYWDYGEVQISDEEQSQDVKDFLASHPDEKTFFTGEFHNDQVIHGIAIHRVCGEIIEQEIGRKLIASDGDIILEYGCRDEDQFFDWGKIFKRHGVEFFSSPKENPEFRARILNECMGAFIEEILGEHAEYNAENQESQDGNSEANQENQNEPSDPNIYQNFTQEDNKEEPKPIGGKRKSRKVKKKSMKKAGKKTLKKKAKKTRKH